MLQIKFIKKKPLFKYADFHDNNYILNNQKTKQITRLVNSKAIIPKNNEWKCHLSFTLMSIMSSFLYRIPSMVSNASDINVEHINISITPRHLVDIVKFLTDWTLWLSYR